MLSVVVFGVVCELTDDDPCQPEPQDADAPTPKTTEATERAAAVEPNTAPAPRRSRRRHAAAPMTPRWWRWRETHRRRRREHPHISFTEFADLSDSRRVILRSDRGFSWSWRHKPDPWSGITRESLADYVQSYLAQIEQDRPMRPQSVVEHLQSLYDIDVDVASVDAALQSPRQIEFGARLQQQLSP